MPVLIKTIHPGSAAGIQGIQPGDTLISINKHAINDVLDYRFYLTSEQVGLELMRGGKAYSVSIEKEEYEDIGLEFETYLMDKQHACKNKCVFCFIDQLPPRMRESLYFKDDDSRMSFLFGNYITMTNLTDSDIDRIIEMRISPVNISVHTTDPALRCEMMKNPNAAHSLGYIHRLVEADIAVNTQLVLCPGINDGAALEKSLRDLTALAPGVQSIACVPVGLTRYREGLPSLRLFTKEEAAETVRTIERFSGEMMQLHGRRIAYPSDEFFLLAGIPVPKASYYGDFDQLENGVGLVALLKDEFVDAMQYDDASDAKAHISIATGVAAAPLLRGLASLVMEKHPDSQVEVHTIQNDFFGHTVNVAGLVTGGDILAQLRGKPLGEALLIPSVMLRHERDCFLDDMTVEQLQNDLKVPVKLINNDGGALYDAMTART